MFVRQIGVGIAKGVQVRAAAQGLARLGAVFLAGVVDQHDGRVEGALHLPQEAEQPGDIRRAVLVQMVQAHQGIEQQHAGLELLERGLQELPIPSLIQAQRGRRDHMQIKPPDIQAPMSAQGIQARTHHRQGIFRQIDQGRPPGLYRKAPQTGRGRGDTHRHVQPQPGLASLRRATNDAHGRPTPELLDQPALLLGLYLQFRGPPDG